MAGKIPPAEREALLAAPLIGVLSVAAEPGRAPLTTPVWHRCTPGGEVLVETSPNSRKAALIRAAGRFSLCVQDTAAVRYVTVEGPVTGIRPVTEEERLATARHHLSDEAAALAYVEATPHQAGNVVVSMRPERWNTADFSALAGERT